MNILKKVYQKIVYKIMHEESKVNTSIKFSDLVLNIQKNVDEMNLSQKPLEHDYIDKYFDKVPTKEQDTGVLQQLEQLENFIDLGEKSIAINLLNTMKLTMQKSIDTDQQPTINYKPKMASFEMPVYENGLWHKKSVKVPLFVFEPLCLHSIKEFTFSSNLDYVKSDGDEVYVRFHQEDKKFRWNSKASNSTRVKILFSPEQNLKELNKVISEYKELLRPSLKKT